MDELLLCKVFQNKKNKQFSLIPQKKKLSPELLDKLNSSPRLLQIRVKRWIK